MTMPELLAFTRMTGDLVKAMRHCPQPIVAAVDGVCAGAGAMIALASDLRSARRAAKTAFLFVRVGLAGCDMGACTLLPRMIGQGRAAELLYTGRAMTARRGRARGASSTALVAPDRAARRSAGAGAVARRRPDVRARDDQEAAAPGMGDGLDEAIEAEAQAQAICMQTQDFRRAYEAFVAKQKPKFEGN